jgi:hypothetical protein
MIMWHRYLKLLVLIINDLPPNIRDLTLSPCNVEVVYMGTGILLTLAFAFNSLKDWIPFYVGPN